MEAELGKAWKRRVLEAVVAAQDLCADTFHRLQSAARPLIEAPMHAAGGAEAAFANAQNALAHLRAASGVLDAAASFMWGAELLGLRGASHHPAHPPLSAADLAPAAAAADDDDDDPAAAGVRAALGMIPQARAAAEDAYMPLLRCRGSRGSLGSVSVLLLHPGLPDAQGCVDRERALALAAFHEALRCTETCHTHVSMASQSLLGL